MAFAKKTWKDRIVQYLNRRKLTDVDTGNIQTVTVTRDEGGITEDGDIFNAATMNDLEDRIDDAFNELTAADISYSAGVSVADKLDSLTTDINTVKEYSASYISSINQGSISAYSVGKIYMLTGYMRASTQISADTVIGSVTGVTLANEIFSSSIGSSGSGLRLMCYADGRLRVERNMPANEWFSYTIIGLLA